MVHRDIEEILRAVHRIEEWLTARAPRTPLGEWLETEEFYDLMQAYRHAPLTQTAASDAFKALKAAIGRYAPTGGVVNHAAGTIAAVSLLQRLRSWDMMEYSVDGPHWKAEIDDVLNKLKHGA